ncbi:hypothetical protein AACH06_26975 [Ideonella sp. DXS29W]|uniref:Baseplate protein J-like domain-containing protein n=1 Tax=Ideonella lacteola TaxID=2984193 RepID=A0ABU9BXL3_9BURK
MHPGSQQDQRLSPALAPGYFRPDELSLAQRLRQVLQLGRHLRFIDTQGSDAGHWGQMLEQDLSILLAEIAAQPVDDLDAEAGQFAWMPPSRAFSHCLRLARQLDRWYALLDDDTEARDQPIRQVLRQPIERALTQSLGKQLQAVLLIAQAPSAAWAGWHTAWGLHARLPQANEAADEPVSSQLRRLRLFWMAMCRLVRLLSVLALQQLPASLTTGLHEPGVGLLLAWTQLLQQTREPLNLFDTRLTHHYYTERLGFLPLPAGADRVHLVLERDPRYPKPVMLPPGWRFVANLDRGSSSYAAEHALHVSPLKVTQLLSLRHVFDRQISPEHEYGFATQALARQWPVPTTDQAADTRAPSVPILGGGAGSVPARQGVAIASPLLALREGLRDIEVTLTVAAPEGVELPLPDAGADLVVWCMRLNAQEAADGYAEPDPTGDQARALAAALQPVLADSPGLRQTPWLAFLLARCLAAHDGPRLLPRLGRFLAVWLCATGAALDASAALHLRAHARAVLNETDHVDVDDPLSLLFSDAPLERPLVFDRVFRGAWRAQLPIATGWLDLGEAFVRRGEAPHGAGAGIVVSLRLSADLPAIVAASETVHGAGWPTLPVLQLLLHNRSRLFASSLLQQLRLDSAEVMVAVHGARSLQLHNQLGRLDPGKPFMPLGPLPDASAYLVFTHAELAAKPLEHLCLNLRWSGLPPRGMARHYAEYPGRDWDEPSFRVQLSLLTEGRWQAAGGPTLPLFGERGQAGHHLEVAGAELLRLHHPMMLQPAPPGQPAEAPEFGLSSRQGFFKLQLASPPDAFGHALYPRLMAETLTANSRVKPERARPLPEAPYTPVLESMTVDYRARQRITARVSAEHAGSGELLHITPFGVQALRHVPPSTPVHVLQRWHGAGQLFIGLDGPSAEGSLSLLFKLRSEAAREALGRPTPGLQWHAWRGHDWVPIEPHRVLLDSTEGMLRTGLVVLDLPAGLTRGCTSLPGHSFWLRLSGQGELDLLAGLIGVWTNGLCARRLGDFCDTPLPAGRIRAALEATPGLATVRQPWPSFDLRPQETPGAWATRVSERLRHRARAISPWDCERLVLQAFPEVFKLKCIPRTSGEPDAPVTVVVVPTLPAGYEIDGTEAPRLDASTLQRIAAYLTDRMPPHQPLLVRNANYERIQVRCTLRLARGEPQGERLRELNQSLRDYLSPWRPGGITTRFDWQLRADEVEAFLRGQPGVEAIGQVSLLHIVSSDQQLYTLSDTARGDRHVRPAHAWSLALPTRGHLLELVDRPSPVAQASGLGKLTVASSFIIGKDAA